MADCPSAGVVNGGCGNPGGALHLLLLPFRFTVCDLAALVACFLAWSLFFVLGEKRPLWQIVTGSVLAGLTIMIRQTYFCSSHY